MNGEPLHLSQPLRVVRIDPSGKGVIVTLPVGATIEITDGKSLPGYIEVRCANVRYNAFESDIRERSSSDSAHGNTIAAAG